MLLFPSSLDLRSASGVNAVIVNDITDKQVLFYKILNIESLGNKMVKY